MVKVLLLSLLVAMMCGLASTLPAPKLARSLRQELFASPSPSAASPVLEDPSTRNERSTNRSFITGTARKIQLYIKNRHLQLLPDGTVNGTDDASSIYTILQRMTVGVGKMKIQGVSTCQYLCMDCSGMLYGSREFSDECLFKEMIEPNNYNTYYSTKYSNDKRTFYLAMNRKGQPKRVMLRANQQLAHMSSFTRVLTRPVASAGSAEERGGIHQHHVRHHSHNTCSPVSTTTSESTLSAHHHRGENEQNSSSATNRPKICTKKKKKRKKKKKCGNKPCVNGAAGNAQNAKKHKIGNKMNNNNKVKKCGEIHGKNSEECQRIAINSNSNNKKRQQQRKFGNSNGGVDNHNNRQQTLNKNKKKNPKFAKNKKSRNMMTTTTTTELPSTVFSPTTSDESLLDEDYIVDNSTHWTLDWDSSSTASPEESFSTSTIINHPD